MLNHSDKLAYRIMEALSDEDTTSRVLAKKLGDVTPNKVAATILTKLQPTYVKIAGEQYYNKKMRGRTSHLYSLTSMGYAWVNRYAYKWSGDT